MNTHPADSSTTFSLRSDLDEVYNLLIRNTRTACVSQARRREARRGEASGGGLREKKKKRRAGEKGARGEDLAVHKPVFRAA